MNFHIVVDALTKILTDIVNFIPNLINGLIILVVGYVIARIVSWIVGFVLRHSGFDPLVERIGITGSMRGLGLTIPLSKIVVQAIFALLLISFFITATKLMGLLAVSQLLERVLTFLPNLIAALILFLLGGIIAQFVGNLANSVAAAAGLSYAKRLGQILQYMISLFIVILSLGVLGIDTALLVTAVTIFIAAFGLAVGLALGLGARGIVHHILAGYYIRQRFPLGQPIELNQIAGEVAGIGGVNTLVNTKEGTVVFPNGMLLESLVRSPRVQDSNSPTSSTA